MTTLAESFLADLEDLSDDEEEVAVVEANGVKQKEEVEGKENELELLKHATLQDIASLSASEKYQTLLTRVNEALSNPGSVSSIAWTGPSDEDPTYSLIGESNSTAVEIENEIAVIHNFVREKYRKKFPELESLVHHPVDYARVVKTIGNEVDMSEVQLEGVLPSATIMVVSVTASTTSGTTLSEEELSKCLEGCDMVLKLDSDKINLLKFVEGRMEAIAPNMSVVLGSECASKLMGIAGGLTSLSKIPACNIQVLGAKRKHLAGFSTSTAQQHQGFISGSPLVLQTPPPLRNKASKLVASKCALLARVDAFGEDPTGNTGEKMKEFIVSKIEKWQEPPPARIVKALVVPDGGPKKRRGGRRFRKMKERYGMTELRKAQNRVNFNKAEEEIMDGEDTVGLGLIGDGGPGGMGKLRLQVSDKRQKVSKSMQKKLQTHQQYKGNTLSGLSSSLAFTPVQGIELENPLAKMAHSQDVSRSGTESYFSTYGGFSQVRKT